MDSFVELDGGLLSVSAFNKHGLEIVFRDSARIFAGSLDGLCRDMKPKHMKQSNHYFRFDINRCDDATCDKTCSKCLDNKPN